MKHHIIMSRAEPYILATQPERCKDHFFGLKVITKFSQSDFLGSGAITL